MAKHIADCTLIVEDKTFTDKESGAKIDYTSVIVSVGGEEIHVSVKKEDKGLLRVLRRDMQQVD